MICRVCRVYEAYTPGGVVSPFSMRCAFIQRGYREQLELVVFWLVVELCDYPKGATLHMRNGIHLGLVCVYDLDLTGLVNIN